MTPVEERIASEDVAQLLREHVGDLDERLTLEQHPTSLAARTFRALATLESSPVNGASLIAVERERQIKEERWDAEHDAGHNQGELAHAAAAYAAGDESLWPWEYDDSWKPTPNDRVRELTKAGALIAAEIDRLLGAESKEQPCQ